jgi:prepilin-type N-terminal cleavage/methylation domain-containing protein
MNHNIKNSFTVIELLVVIAIIGVLASFVLVSLSGTRDRAQIVKTLLYSNQVYHSLGADAVGYWKFDEGSGTTAIDSSGYNNNGTIIGAAYTTETPYQAAGQGSGKYALSFNGSNNYVTIPDNNSLDITGAITLEAWAKFNSVAGYNVIVGKRDVAGGSGSYSMRAYSNGDFEFFLYGVSDNFLTAGTSTIVTGRWYHLVCTYNGATKKIYIDGVERASEPTTGSITKTSLIVTIGADALGSRLHNGIIDEVRIYSAALTASEIQQHYADGLGKHQNLTIK